MNIQKDNITKFILKSYEYYETHMKYDDGDHHHSPIKWKIMIELITDYSL